MSDLSDRNCYRLQLTDDQGWCITSDRGTSGWLDEFASILRLERSSPETGLPFLYVHQGNNAKLQPSRDVVEATPNTRRDSTADWRPLHLHSLVVWSNAAHRDIICQIARESTCKGRILSMWNCLLPIYMRAIDAGGIPMHAALIEKNNTGALLVAPGGTGKSTSCRRLPSPWKTLCDDETLLIPNGSGRYFAHPFPTWSNHILDREPKTWQVEHCVEIEAVFFLRQADDDGIERLGRGESAVLINQSADQVCRRVLRAMDASERKSRRESIFASAADLAVSVPAFSLNISLNGRFWELIEDTIFNHKKRDNSR